MILQEEITLEHTPGIAMCSMLIHDAELCLALYGDDYEYQDYLDTHKEYDL